MAQKKDEKIERFKFGKLNALIFILSIVVIIVGFVIVNSTQTFGTILLVLGYAVLIPLSLLIKSKKIDQEAQ